jgi:chemotaxis protein methyltransferase CheR
VTDISGLITPQPVDLRLTTEDYQGISQLAYERFGIDLRNGKRELVSARIAKLLRKTEFRSVDELYRHVLADQSGESLIKLINALTTNYTSFFREAAHFELLRTQIVPELCSRSKIEVWSAAAATGEEIYSIALCLLEQLGAAGYQKVHILGSDISTKALGTAEAGTYSADRLHGLSGDLIRRYFLRGRNAMAGMVQDSPRGAEAGRL